MKLQGHKEIPTTVKSREEMLPNVPAMRQLLEAAKATDLAEMILGEDA